MRFVSNIIWVRLVYRIHSVDRKPVRRVRCIADHNVIVKVRGVWIRDQLRRRVLPARRSGGDEVLVIEKRPSEARVEEVVTQYIFSSQNPFRKLARVQVAHYEATVIAPCDKLVHLAAINL